MEGLFFYPDLLFKIIGAGMATATPFIAVATPFALPVIAGGVIIKVFGFKTPS